MRILTRLVGVVVLVASTLYSQTNATDQSKQDFCRLLDPMIFPPEACSAIRAYVSPADQVGFIAEDGSFIVLAPRADGKGNVTTYTLPPKLRSEIALNGLRVALEDIMSIAKSKPDSVFAGMFPDGRALWIKLRDAYCYYHPESAYISLGNTENTVPSQKCDAVTAIPDEKTLNDQFSQALVFESNYRTFLLSDNCNGQRECLQALVDVYKPVLGSIEKHDQQKQTPPPPAPTQAATVTEPPHKTGPSCGKNISFAMPVGGRIQPAVPDFAAKWIDKNQNHYPDVCFSQTPVPNAENYLLVFSNSESATMGFYPKVQTSTSTNTSPVSGNGTITDNYGGMWYYSYNGTVTTTTTTTQNLNLPYTDVSNTLYVHGYNQRGVLLVSRQRTVTRRSGGDAYNTLGYNLGSLFSSIHVKERLLKEAVNDLVRSNPR